MNRTCYKCTKKGHVAKIYKYKLVQNLECEECDNKLLILRQTNHKEGTPAIVIEVLINDKVIRVELDASAAVSIMPEVECAKHFPNASCREANVKLAT